MSLRTLEEKVLSVPGAAERVAKIEQDLRFAVALAALCENVLGHEQRSVQATQVLPVSPLELLIRRCPSRTQSHMRRGTLAALFTTADAATPAADLFRQNVRISAIAPAAKIPPAAVIHIHVPAGISVQAISQREPPGLHPALPTPPRSSCEELVGRGADRCRLRGSGR